MHFEYASSLYANSLLSNLRAVVLVSPDLDKAEDIRKTNIYNDLKIPSRINPFKVKKVLWNSQEIDNDIFIVSGMRFINISWDSFISENNFKIGFNSELSRAFRFRIPVENYFLFFKDSERNLYFSVLVDGDFSDTDSFTKNPPEFSKDIQSAKEYVSTHGLENYFNDRTWFKPYAGVLVNMLHDNSDPEKDFILTSKFVEDYTLMINKFGNPVTELPPDVQVLRSQLQTDLGRSVLDKLVKYFEKKSEQN